RDAVLDVIEGAHPRHLAAAGHYGFIDREKDEYWVTERFKAIHLWTSEEEKREELKKAFGSPTLYQKLIEKYDGGEIPKQLPAILVRFYGITESKSDEVAQI